MGCASIQGNEVDAEITKEKIEPLVKSRPASRISPNLFSIKDPLVEAVEAHLNGNKELAYEKFYAAWLASPESEAVVIGLVKVALETGHAEQAYAAVSNLKGDLGNVNPALLAAEVLSEIAVGKSPDAELRLNQALENAPNDPRLWNALGRFYDAEGLWLQAQDCYVRSFELGGSKAGLNNNLGMSLLMQGQMSAALSKFEQAIGMGGDVDLYDNNRRLTLAVMGKFDEAMNGASHSLSADILNDVGYIAKLSRQNSQAETLFKAAIKQSETYHIKAHENMNALKFE